MAATSLALEATLFGPSLAAAITNHASSDILQIVDEGGNVLLNVDSAGAVHNPASSPTKETVILGVRKTNLTSGTTAALFADVFDNPISLDILQVENIGGNISYYLDASGVAHGS